MQSKNNTDDQKKHRTSFIEEARRTQIIDATINTLSKHGYTNTSFVRIGKEAAITPSLIGYHFKNKDELIQATLRTILMNRATYVTAKLQGAVNASDKLRIAIEADLDHMAANIHMFKALAEIIFTIRSDEGTLIYLGDSDADLFNLTYTILKEGRQTGEFGNIDTQSMAIIIDGARDSFLARLGLQQSLDVHLFKKTLTDTIMTAIKKGSH